MAHSMNKTKSPPSWSSHVGGSDLTGTPPLDTWLMWVLLSYWSEEVSWTLTNSFPPVSRPFCTNSAISAPPSHTHVLLALAICLLWIPTLDVSDPGESLVSGLLGILSWEWATHSPSPLGLKEILKLYLDSNANPAAFPAVSSGESHLTPLCLLSSSKKNNTNLIGML